MAWSDGGGVIRQMENGWISWWRNEEMGEGVLKGLLRGGAGI